MQQVTTLSHLLLTSSTHPRESASLPFCQRWWSSLQTPPRTILRSIYLLAIFHVCRNQPLTGRQQPTLSSSLPPRPNRLWRSIVFRLTLTKLSCLTSLRTSPETSFPHSAESRCFCPRCLRFWHLGDPLLDCLPKRSSQRAQAKHVTPRRMPNMLARSVASASPGRTI